jgi:hypothetical protein
MPRTALARIIREARRENVKSAEDPRTSDRRPAQTYYQYVEQAEGRREKAVEIRCFGRSQQGAHE